MDGTVVNMRAIRSRTHNRRGTTYAPDVRYVVDGTTYTHASKTATAGRSFKVGELVGVFYDRAAPARAHLDRFTHLWFWPMLLGLTGGAFTVVASMLFAFWK